MSDKKKKFIGIVLFGIGIAMFVFSLLTIFLGATLPGSILLIFSLFSIFLGSRFLPLGGMLSLEVIMLIFSLFSIFLGWRFFSYSWLQLYYRIAQLLILTSGLVFIISSIFLFKLKEWARKLIINYSAVLLFYFIPLSLILIGDPFGWGRFMALSFLPYIIFPLFFIIFLTRPKIKELFKR